MMPIVLDFSKCFPVDVVKPLITALDQRCAEHAEPREPEFLVNGQLFHLTCQHYGPAKGKYFFEHWSRDGGVVIAEGEYCDTAAEAQQAAIRYVQVAEAVETNRKEAIMEHARATGNQGVIRAVAVELFGEE